MLCFKRKVGETFQIGDDVTVKIMGVRGSQIRIGVLAPPHIKVLRDNAIKKEKTAK